MTVTTVFGVGTSEAAPESVAVGVTIRGEGETTQQATEIAKAKMADLYEVIRRLEAAGLEIGASGLTTRFSVGQMHAREARRYEARFVATVTSRSTDRAGEMFNLLVTIDGAEVSSPRFAIGDALRQKLRNDAFRSAVKTGRARFAFQCEVIGFDPSEFEIVSWRYDGPNYGHTTGKRLNVGSSEVIVSGEPVEVSCDVYLTYDRKDAGPTPAGSRGGA